MDNSKLDSTRVSEHYTSGEYWDKHKDSDSAYKVDLIRSLLQKSGLLDKLERSNASLKIAETGCGQGAFTFPLARYLDDIKQDFQLFAYDISPQAIDLAKSRSNYPENKLLFSTGGSDCIVSDLDFICAMDVMEHVENPLNMLRELAGKSKYLLLHLPIEQSFGHLLLKSPSKSYDNYRHIHFYSWETAKILINSSDYSIVDYQFTPASMSSISLPGSYLSKIFRSIRYFFYKLNPELAAIFSGGSVMLCLTSK